ncbi:MAG: hypothetical protein HGB22_04205 [Chlorobiaceae bacterium]|nr:hypothetical protein [Chlorobiaceae bacterium]
MDSNVSRRILKMIILVLLPFFLFLSSSSSYSADKPKASSADKAKPEKITFRVLDVTNVRPKNKDRARLGDKISVKVDSLGALMKLANNDINKIELTINDTVVPDLRPLRKADDNTLEYLLASNEKNHAIWDSLGIKSNKLVMPVTISLAFDNDKDNKSADVRGYDFKLILKNNTVTSILFGIGAALFAISFIRLGKLDARLRNYGPDSPYSLALVQMAVWYYIVTMSFIYLYVTNGCMPELNNSTMILLGISSVTAVGAKVIDSSNKDKMQEVADKASDTGAEKDNGGKTMSEKLEELKSRNFIYDILSDEYGLALSRFQIFVWTIIMGVIFVNDVLTTAAIPDFSDTNVLTLMGISSGSYVGYKMKEDYTKKVNG